MRRIEATKVPNRCGSLHGVRPKGRSCAIYKRGDVAQNVAPHCPPHNEHGTWQQLTEITHRNETATEQFEKKKKGEATGTESHGRISLASSVAGGDGGRHTNSTPFEMKICSKLSMDTDRDTRSCTSAHSHHLLARVNYGIHCDGLARIQRGWWRASNVQRGERKKLISFAWKLCSVTSELGARCSARSSPAAFLVYRSDVLRSSELFRCEFLM